MAYRRKADFLLRAGSLIRVLGWHRIPLIKKAGLALARRVGGQDVTIRHPWVPDRRLRLNPLRHKGYWFHGRQREHAVMEGFASLVRSGDVVIELGGHIGFTTIYLASLVGPHGKVIVFEPSPANLVYLEENVGDLPQVEIVRSAVSDRKGQVPFFVEGLTGQNCTLVADYAVFKENKAKAFSSEQYSEIMVDCIPLDEFLAARDLRPDFIKIDVEGAELLALQGMPSCLQNHMPHLMVEMTNEAEAVTGLLQEAGYTAFDRHLRLASETEDQDPNRFFLHQEEAGSVPEPEPEPEPEHTGAAEPRSDNDNEDNGRKPVREAASFMRQAAMVLLLLGSGWFARGVIDPIAPAADAKTFFNEAAQSRRAMLMNIMMGSANPEPRSPDVSELKAATGIGLIRLPREWRAINAQVFPSDSGPSIQLMVYDDRGELLSLFVMRAETPAGDHPMIERREGVSVAYWEDGDLAYALTGRMPANALEHRAAVLATISRNS